MMRAAISSNLYCNNLSLKCNIYSPVSTTILPPSTHNKCSTIHTHIAGIADCRNKDWLRFSLAIPTLRREHRKVLNCFFRLHLILHYYFERQHPLLPLDLSIPQTVFGESSYYVIGTLWRNIVVGGCRLLVSLFYNSKKPTIYHSHLSWNLLQWRVGRF